ncbi:MAG: hypothetical protein AAGC63_04070 [Propionicimonas sp.]|nr:hypothetical protein [Propionicimonas sp.]
MFLGDLLGRPVLQSGRQVGYLADVRLHVPDRSPGQRLGDPRVYGVVVCPRRTGSFDGYERRGLDAPALLARYFRWRARGSFLVLWEDLAHWGEPAVELRPGASRWSPELPPSGPGRGRSPQPDGGSVD